VDQQQPKIKGKNIKYIIIIKETYKQNTHTRARARARVCVCVCVKHDDMHEVMTYIYYSLNICVFYFFVYGIKIIEIKIHT